MTERLCSCGHPVASHQTGTGPWTGFCYALASGDDECECERPDPSAVPDQAPDDVYEGRLRLDPDAIRSEGYKEGYRDGYIAGIVAGKESE